MNRLLQALKSGASLRYRPPHGFYTVLAGKSTPLPEATGRAAVQSGLVRPAGKDQHGVYLFTLSPKARHAMPTLPSHPQALPARSAAVPPALPDVSALRRQADSKTAAPVPADGRAAPGPVQAGAGAVVGAGARRDCAAQAGKGQCMGCGGCAGKSEGVKA